MTASCFEIKHEGNCCPLCFNVMQDKLAAQAKALAVAREALESLRLPHGTLDEIGDDHCCHHLVEEIDKALARMDELGKKP